MTARLDRGPPTTYRAKQSEGKGHRAGVEGALVPARGCEAPGKIPSPPPGPWSCTILTSEERGRILPGISAGVLAVASPFWDLAKFESLHPGVGQRVRWTINMVPPREPAHSLPPLAAAWTAGLFCPKTMSVALLWLGFTLLGALHTQARSSTPRLLRAPALSKIPLQPNFQADQVRAPEGQWQGAGREACEQRGREVKGLIEPARAGCPGFIQLSLPSSHLMEARLHGPALTLTLLARESPGQIFSRSTLSPIISVVSG